MSQPMPAEAMTEALEQRSQLAASVRRFVADHYDTQRRRELAQTDPGFSKDQWRRMGEMGWTGLTLPEAFGGLACSVHDRVAIAEELGRGLVPEPYLGTAVFAAELIQHAGSEAQKDKWLPAISEGTAVVAFAATEAGSYYEFTELRCKARRNAGGYVMSGRKSVVLDAPSADVLVVLARTGGAGDACALFLVDPKAPGVVMRPFRTVDGRRCAEIEFNAVRLDETCVMGSADGARAAVDHATSHAIVGACAEATGVLSALVETTIAYLKTRVQFGKPLASFQVLRHRVADMYVACEEARSITLYAAGQLASDPQLRDKACSAAKVKVGRASRFVGQQAVQLHGGIGMTDELDVGHYFKRLMALEAQYGNVDFHLRRFGRMA